MPQYITPPYINSHDSDSNTVRSGPFARIALSLPYQEEFVFGEDSSCYGLLDTGSPITFIPKDLILELNAPLIGPAVISYGVGGHGFYDPYSLSIRLDGIILPNRSVLAWSREIALIGRDILDELEACFNGEEYFLTH
ncbi:pepsin/retropepsin-like aspartic protease family protein [Acaryochloris marina]|uniref:hypothetical protein n=1 Tax=Acaryochloris marina TaxID=155978 RepID=UPI0011D12F23|nr:hypothetical protein [Acaryochloris marina]BDM82033.1 hypothetical protein AM10699_48970 [Acaryochloris marina MBIC10699]